MMICGKIHEKNYKLFKNLSKSLAYDFWAATFIVLLDGLNSNGEAKN